MLLSPEPLKNLCLKCCVSNLKLTLMESVHSYEDDRQSMETDGYHSDSKSEDDEFLEIDDGRGGCVQFYNGLFLPEEICEPIMQQTLIKFRDYYIKPFHDATKCRLRRIDLSQTEISDQSLITGLFVHPLYEINLNGCIVYNDTLWKMKECATTLRHLMLSCTLGTGVGWGYSALRNLTNLETLDLSHTKFGRASSDMEAVAELKHLAWLDLSECEVGDISQLISLQSSLTWLSLYNCANIKDKSSLINTLQQMTSLVHLDLSKDPPETDDDLGSEQTRCPPVDDAVLQTLADLPCLKSLDISGSVSLSGASLRPFQASNHQLTFLGLFRTGLCYHVNLPAEVVTGEASELQIYASLEVYPKRLLFVLNSLRDLFNVTSSHSCQNPAKAIQLVMTAMKNHCDDNGVQIAGSASLYHLSRGNNVNDKELRRAIVTTVLDAMEFHPKVLQLLKNCCLTLCNFNIPDEVEFEYIRMADILLSALAKQKDNYLRRIAITLFNAIVCHNSGDQKLAVGQRGSIKIIVDVIREKIIAREADLLLETCWSSLWNVTDETPENCQDFIECGGMDLFLHCLDNFPEAPEIQRNMMGLLGNVAEVKFLRPMLMKKQYLKIFYQLLDTSKYELEVNYNAGGVLAHIASDETEEWCVEWPRHVCMERLMASIEEWDIRSNRNINYRSFEPILRLLRFFNAPAVQRWATWALANLTMVYPERYCKLLQDEGGVELLRAVADDSLDTFSAKLAADTVYHVTKFLGQAK